jgi:hypothetical protein
VVRELFELVAAVVQGLLERGQDPNTDENDDVVTVSISNIRGSTDTCAVKVSARNLDGSGDTEYLIVLDDNFLFVPNVRGSLMGSFVSGNGGRTTNTDGREDINFSKRTPPGQFGFTGFVDWVPGKVTLRNSCVLFGFDDLAQA